MKIDNNKRRKKQTENSEILNLNSLRGGGDLQVSGAFKNENSLINVQFSYKYMKKYVSHRTFGQYSV